MKRKMFFLFEYYLLQDKASLENKEESSTPWVQRVFIGPKTNKQKNSEKAGSVNHRNCCHF